MGKMSSDSQKEQASAAPGGGQAAPLPPRSTPPYGVSPPPKLEPGSVPPESDLREDEKFLRWGEHRVDPALRRELSAVKLKGLPEERLKDTHPPNRRALAAPPPPEPESKPGGFVPATPIVARLQVSPKSKKADSPAGPAEDSSLLAVETREHVVTAPTPSTAEPGEGRPSPAPGREQVITARLPTATRSAGALAPSDESKSTLVGIAPPSKQPMPLEVDGAAGKPGRPPPAIEGMKCAAYEITRADDGSILDAKQIAEDEPLLARQRQERSRRVAFGIVALVGAVGVVAVLANVVFGGRTDDRGAAPSSAQQGAIVSSIPSPAVPESEHLAATAASSPSSAPAAKPDPAVPVHPPHQRASEPPKRAPAASALTRSKVGSPPSATPKPTAEQPLPLPVKPNTTSPRSAPGAVDALTPLVQD
jgi:hypothetical protein